MLSPLSLAWSSNSIILDQVQILEPFVACPWSPQVFSMFQEWALLDPVEFGFRICPSGGQSDNLGADRRGASHTPRVTCPRIYLSSQFLGGPYAVRPSIATPHFRHHLLVSPCLACSLLPRGWAAA